MKPPPARAPAVGGAHDFDFLFGRWAVMHRRLKYRLAHSDEWESFPGTSMAQPILNGQGNVDDNVLALPEGNYRAATLRTFDANSQTWMIWWLDARNPHHLDPPVAGSFHNGVGLFYADDQYQGRPIRVRYRWSNITPTSACWEQAFSPDGGATWETNWYMTFTHVGPPPAVSGS